MRLRNRIEIKTPDQVRHMRRAGLVVADIHAALREAVRPGATTGEAPGRAGRLNAVGDTVEDVVAEARRDHDIPIGILEDYVGHGIGTAMHMAPDVLNYSVKRRGPRLQPGMVLAVEPMLAAGEPEVEELDDGWTVVTVDGSRAAQWEHTVALVPGGVWVLTASDGGVEGLDPYGIEPRPLR